MYKSEKGEKREISAEDPLSRRYQAFFFGPFRVVRDEHLLGESAWRRNKAKTLLKWFLLNPGQYFSADQLNNLCWPGVEQEIASKNLHVTIHYLRHILEPDLGPGQKSRFLRRNRHNFYWFDLSESWWLDILDIEQLSTRAQEAELRGNLLAAIECYHKLIDYFTVGFLPEEVYEDTFSTYRRQYDYAHAQVLEKVMHLCTQAHMLDHVLTYSLQALSVDPYCETAVKALVGVYIEQGNITGALHTLDTFHDLVHRDLGITPSQEIGLLRDHILCNQTENP